MDDMEARVESVRRCIERLKKIDGDRFAENMARALEKSLAARVAENHRAGDASATNTGGTSSPESSTT